ncbi:hypothetical protein GQ55_3G160600 [Panicum hallii var. hallii]|uniref:Uncharacterized protein n=1 Tax=Panicum hallii var. hallii TaxID=1504633 RepID=A0A2T7EA09_9POAL|nr:hypothetical protein GQ55_3G160600 [Panicum hallii var. hallii]
MSAARRGGAAPPDRLLRRGPVGAGRRHLVGGARPGGGRVRHFRLLRRALPGPGPGAPRRALRRRREAALRSAGRRQAPQPLRARQALLRLPRRAPGSRRPGEPRHRGRLQARGRPRLRRPRVARRRRRRRRFLRGPPWRGEADGRAGGGGAEDGAGGARGGRAPRAAERVDMAPLPDVGVRRRGEEGQAPPDPPDPTRTPTRSAWCASTRWSGWRCGPRAGSGSASRRRRRRSSSWSATRSGHGQTTVCKRHFTGLPSVGMSTDTLPSCSRSPAAGFSRPLNLWTTNTLPVSSHITTTTSCASPFLRKALATKISSIPTVDYRQQNASAVQPGTPVWPLL